MSKPPRVVRKSAYDEALFSKRGRRPWPLTSQKTNVVVVGLGAAGGTAVLPLARAGLDVIGLEAGDWLTPRDFAPDELRNNVRGWPQSVQKANQEVPTHRRDAKSPYSPRPAFHPMMNAVGGTTLHFFAQAWRLSPWDFKVVSETTRRYGASRVPKGCTVEDWPFGYEELEPYYDKIDYEVGVSGKAGNIKSKIDPRGNIFEGPRSREYPMPPLRLTEFTEHMAGAAKKLGWAPFPGAALINSVAYDKRPALRLSRLLHARRVPRQREERAACYDHTESARNQTALGGDARPRDAHRRRRKDRTRDRRHLSERRRRIFSARRCGAARGLHLRKRAPAAALEIESVSQRPRQQQRTGRAPLHDAQHGVARDRAVSAQHQQLVRHAGAGCRARQLGRRQLRSRRARFHRRRQSLRLFRSPADRRGDDADLRQADLGLRSGKRSSSRTPTAGTSPRCRRRRCPTKTTCSISIPR